MGWTLGDEDEKREEKKQSEMKKEKKKENKLYKFVVFKWLVNSRLGNVYWGLAMPTYAMVIVVLALGFYVVINFMSTPTPTTLNTIFDEYSREPSSLIVFEEGDDEPIEPIFDISCNDLTFYQDF
ncbi:hypothetical protein UlMin_041368 [Ulmus minor]